MDEQGSIRQHPAVSNETPALGAADGFERGSDTSFLVDAWPVAPEPPEPTPWIDTTLALPLALLLAILLLHRHATRRSRSEVPASTTVTVAHWSHAQAPDNDFPGVTRRADDDSLAA
jgi:hypothetical protein